jgi:RNA polymerase sigma-70 factor (ECF subfamily)
MLCSQEQEGSLPQTSIGLLERVQQHPDDSSWQRLVDLYTPLIRGWLHRHGVARDDADDLTQDVLSVMVRELPHFRHGPRPGAFRCWLRTITLNRLRGFWRARHGHALASGDSAVNDLLEQLEDPHGPLAEQWDEEHDRYVLRQLLEVLEPEFSPTTWRAFCRTVLDGERTATVAAELGISTNAVLISKSRVLRRLRQEARGFLEE